MLTPRSQRPHAARVGNADDFMRLSPLRGLSARQSLLLSLRAHVEHSQYADREPWSPAVRNVGGSLRLIPAVEREPAVQVGLAAQTVQGLVDRLCGEGSEPEIHLEDVTTGEREGANVDAVAEALGEDAMDLAGSMLVPLTDLVVCGSLNLGFHWPDESPWPELVHLAPEWCEPVYVSQVKGDRARAIAADLAERAGVSVPVDERGPYLPAPAGARGRDLAFLRYEWPTDEADGRDGQTPTGQRKIWRRRDYMPDAIVEYEPIEVRATTARRPEFDPLPVDPHMWGVVPFVWVAAPGAVEGDVDGPSILTPPLLSIAEAVDYTRTREHDAVAINCAPLLHLRDLERAGARQSYGAAGLVTPEIQTDAGAVLETTSTGTGGASGAAELLEMSGDAPRAARELAAGLLEDAAALSGIQRHNPADAGVSQSGVSRRLMMQPTIKRVGAYRGVVSKALRGFVRALSRALEARGVTSGPVVASVEWPEQVALTATDLLAAAQALTTACVGPVISGESATRLFAQLAEIEGGSGEWERMTADSSAALAVLRDRVRTPPPGE